MVTIKEIAELAGVSTTTVSNVIHGKTKKVSPGTIQKIDKLIKELGYVQKMGLRVLSKENSQLIAVVINSHREFKDSILGDPFYGQILGFIEKYARELGYYVMFYSAKDMDQIFQMVMGWNIDGVIAVSFSKRNCEKIYQLTKKPIVSIDAYGELEDQQDKQRIQDLLAQLRHVPGVFKGLKHLKSPRPFRLRLRSSPLRTPRTPRP